MANGSIAGSISGPIRGWTELGCYRYATTNRRKLDLTTGSQNPVGRLARSDCKATWFGWAQPDLVVGALSTNLFISIKRLKQPKLALVEEKFSHMLN